MGEPAIDYDDYDDTWYEDELWKPEGDVEEEPIILTKARESLPTIPSVLPSAFTANVFQMPKEDGTGYAQFSFEGRRHMKRIYDTPARKVLLCCGRQVEKTVVLSSNVLLPNGDVTRAEFVRVGDQVATLDVPGGGYRMTSGSVVWKSRTYKKPCVRITTRQGHVCEVARTHPMRTWGGWTDAGDLVLGSRLAVVRKSGLFVDAWEDDSWVRYVAFMLGDGCLDNDLSFTALPGPGLYDFLDCLDELGVCYSITPKSSTAAVSVRPRKLGSRWIKDLLGCYGLFGTRSKSKFIPSWVFDLPRVQTALFLNRLWSTDGHVKQNSRSKYSLEYCSVARRLLRGVQSLLWKFGIPSKIRKNWPNYWKKRGVKKYAWILRVETQEGVRLFLQDIACLGKSEGIATPTCAESNNRDTYPEELNLVLKNLGEARPGPRNLRGSDSLRARGLREKPKYSLTRRKLKEYVDYYSAIPGASPAVLRELRGHLCSDVYWDSVTKIEDIGIRDCVDFEVDGTHNFVCDGFVTHNSTLIGNISIAYMTLVVGLRILFVSPSSTQTKTFSNDRIKEPIETSPFLSRFTTSMLTKNIFEKQFLNRSMITLRYAYLNADRTRGIPAWQLFLDEIQDILRANIPVIEHCLGHAPDKYRRQLYSGTPKSLDNIIEDYRANLSTQGEWVVPCEACGHWNILGEKNIGKKGPICARCGKIIDPQSAKAQWAWMVKPDPTDPNKVPWESYRIPQIMVPWKIRNWDEVIYDYENHPRAQFMNECLGISYESGFRPITTAQVREACGTHSIGDIEKIRNLSLSQPFFMGVDWGSGDNSYTIVVIATYIDNRFRVVFAHRFVGEEADPHVQLSKIIELARHFNIYVIGADYGFGFGMNNYLTREFGATKVQKFQYMATARKKVQFDPKMGRWKVHRTEAMAAVFDAIKKKKAEFPKWDEFQTFAKDFTNIYSEYNERLRMVMYDHKQGNPDDSFHAFVYCWLASMIVIPRPDIIHPTKEDDQGNVVDTYSGPLDQG